MNPIIEDIVRNAHKLYERQDVEPITKTNPFLYNVSHLCITNRELMGQIPAQEGGYLGFAYMHILDLTDEPSVFQIYSTISFYFIEKALQYGYVNDTGFSQIHVQTLNDALIIMNIGARSLCRTFAQAQGIEPSDYINFDNLYSLPSYVKQILLCEYSYFIEFEKALATVGITLNRDPQMYQRFNMLKKFVSTGFFEEFGADSSLYNKAKELRRLVYSYAASKIDKGDIIFR